MNFIDNFLNKITMYRLVFYYLVALIGIAAIFGAFRILPYNPSRSSSRCSSSYAHVYSLTPSSQNFPRPRECRICLHHGVHPDAHHLPHLAQTPGNRALARLRHRPRLHHCASFFAMASKYILAVHRKHIFNPAAIAVVATGFALSQYASWWVGGNLTLSRSSSQAASSFVRKIQRFDLVLTFFRRWHRKHLLTNVGFDPAHNYRKGAHRTLPSSSSASS